MWWELIYWLVTLSILAWSLFTKDGRDAWGWFFSNFVASALKQASPLVKELGPDLEEVYKSFSAAVNSSGPGLVGTLGADFQKIAAKVLEAQRHALATIGTSTPENALDTAAEAFKVAFGAGLTSAGVTAAIRSEFCQRS